MWTMHVKSMLAGLLTMLCLNGCMMVAKSNAFEADAPISLPKHQEVSTKVSYEVAITQAGWYSPYLMIQTENADDRLQVTKFLRDHPNGSAKIKMENLRTKQVIAQVEQATEVSFFGSTEIGLMLLPKYLVLDPGSYRVTVELFGDYRDLPSNIQTEIRFTNMYRAK